jgi:hypothetical protein
MQVPFIYCTAGDPALFTQLTMDSAMHAGAIH